MQSAFSLKISLVLISSSAIAYALIYPGSRLNSSLACLGFAWSNLAKKNKRLFAVYEQKLKHTAFIRIFHFPFVIKFLVVFSYPV